MELRSELIDREFEHICFATMEELWQQGYFQLIYSLRAAGTPEISVRPCLFFSSETPK